MTGLRLLTAFLAAGLLSAAAPPIAPSASTLGELPRQTLQKGQCALFLWERASQRRVLMATTAPAAIKVVRAGKTLVLPETAASGERVMGFAPRTSFAGAGFSVGLDLEIDSNAANSAIVRGGILTVTGADGGAVVVPVGGLIGCS